MKQTFYLPELDTLRFFAFLAVFLCHYALASHPVGLLISGMAQVTGHGVDLFFALSAYLLTELMLREKEETGHVNLAAFYARRGLRIWPLYYVYLTLVFVASLKWPSPSMSPAHFAQLATFTGDLPGGSPSLVLCSLWSISLEEQFYLVWPLIVRHLSRRAVGFAATVAWAATVVLRVLMFATGHGLGALAIVTHLDSIFAGLVIVGFGFRGRPLLCLPGVVAWTVGAYYAVHPLSPIVLSLASASIGVGSGAFLLSCIGAKALANRVTVYLGRISYGLYVFHGLAYVLAMALLPGIIAVPVAFAFTLGGAAVSYQFLERPFLKLKERFQYVRSQPLL